MPSTNKTTNLQLSQFGSADMPKWLQDYNSDMDAIDKKVASRTGIDATSENITQSTGTHYYLNRTVNGTISGDDATVIITNCTGTITVLGDTAKVYIVNSPLLQLSGKTVSNWRNIFIDGIAEFKLTSGLTIFPATVLPTPTIITGLQAGDYYEILIRATDDALIDATNVYTGYVDYVGRATPLILVWQVQTGNPGCIRGNTANGNLTITTKDNFNYGEINISPMRLWRKI